MHAAEVTHCAYYIWSQLAAQDHMKGFFTNLDLLVVALTAAVHDMAHPGTGNDFLVKTEHALAVRYLDRSVLEHFHAASAFALMQAGPYWGSEFMDIHAGEGWPSGERQEAKLASFYTPLDHPLRRALQPRLEIWPPEIPRRVVASRISSAAPLFAIAPLLGYGTGTTLAQHRCRTGTESIRPCAS